MSFPDTIERTLELPHPRDRVWAALTTADGLGTWFGNRADVDLRVGGLVRLAWDSGDTATLTLERLEEPHVVAWSWRLDGLPEDDPRRTLVEFTLTPGGPDGTGTTLRMVESGFAQAPDAAAHARAYEGNQGGWTHELGELVDYLDARA